jgi:hypothetical protein
MNRGLPLPLGAFASLPGLPTTFFLIILWSGWSFVRLQSTVWCPLGSSWFWMWTVIPKHWLANHFGGRIPQLSHAQTVTGACVSVPLQQPYIGNNQAKLIAKVFRVKWRALPHSFKGLLPFKVIYLKGNREKRLSRSSYLWTVSTSSWRWWCWLSLSCSSRSLCSTFSIQPIVENLQETFSLCDGLWGHVYFFQS